jgi:hypothetical protein
VLEEVRTSTVLEEVRTSTVLEEVRTSAVHSKSELVQCIVRQS